MNTSMEFAFAQAGHPEQKKEKIEAKPVASPVALKRPVLPPRGKKVKVITAERE